VLYTVSDPHGRRDGPRKCNVLWWCVIQWRGLLRSIGWILIESGDGRTDREADEEGFEEKITLFQKHKLTKLYLLNFKNIVIAGWTVRISNDNRTRRFSVPHIRSDRLCGPPSLLLSGCLGSFRGVKRSRREVAQWPSSRGEVKNEGSFSSAPSIHLHGVDRSNFTFPSLVIYFCHFLHKVRFDGCRLHDSAWRVHF